MSNFIRLWYNTDTDEPLLMWWMIMSTYEMVLAYASKLNEDELEVLLESLEELLVLGSFTSEIDNNVKETRFANGKLCPHCGGHHICRNGKYNGKQRYICRGCRRSFTDFTFSPAYYSNKHSFDTISII